MKTTAIFGPPGTGKTTFLCREFVQPAIGRKVAVVSFSKAAAEQLLESVFPSPTAYVGTIHALCFRTLGLNRSEVIAEREVSEQFGLDEEQVKSVLNLDAFARAVYKSVDEIYWSYVVNDPYALSLDEVKRFQSMLTAYKSSNGKVDFTDMLEMVLARGIVPKFESVFVDEAQDLTPLQWAVIEAMKPKKLVVAGDDDQAIYSFFGADPHRMRQLADKTIVLSESYRVPECTWELATEISCGIRHRQEKEWGPRNAKGKIVRGSDPVYSIYDNRELIKDGAVALFRDRYVLQEVADELTGIGVPWFSPVIWSPYRNRWVSTVVAVREGTINDPLNEHLQRNLNEGARGRSIPRGSPPEDFLDMNRVPVPVLGVLDQDLSAMIELSTIHGFKGREANTVFLTMFCTPRVGMAAYMEELLDDELRVWYTAVTRAKETLFLIGENEFVKER